MSDYMYTSSSKSGRPVQRNEISDNELSACDREKLHLVGGIQGDAGHVIYLRFPDGQIIAADAQIRAVPWVRPRGTPNLKRKGIFSNDSLLGCEDSTSTASTATATSMECVIDLEDMEAKSRELLGTYLQYWIPFDLYRELFEAIEGMKNAKSTRTFHFYKHRRTSYAITLSTTFSDCAVVGIEIETIDGNETTSSFYSTLVSLGRIMEFYADEKIVTAACDTIFDLIGEFDRGMVYQFNDDNSGEVVHEIKKDFVKTSYMGMRFPASDIPKASRDLYIDNGLRYIQDSEAKDIPLLEMKVVQESPDNMNGNSDIDLTQCRMRAVGKPHVL